MGMGFSVDGLAVGGSSTGVAGGTFEMADGLDVGGASGESTGGTTGGARTSGMELTGEPVAISCSSKKSETDTVTSLNA